jgi:hypothetical protein
MMAAILPDVETAIKTLPTDRIESHSDWQSQSTTGGSIVIRLGLDGIRTVEIIANQSDEDIQLRQRLTAARPVLELLQAVVMAE